MLEVHTWEVNSNSGKPLLFLKEKGVDFEFHYVDVLRFEQHSPEYLALNPEGTVPTVIHDGKVLTESTQALEYLDRVLPGPSFTPEHPLERERMRWWAIHGASWAASLSVLGWHAFMGPMVRKLGDEELDRLIARIPTKERRIAWATAARSTFTDEQLQDARDGVARGVQMMEARLKASPWFAGESYSIADIVIFANAYSLPLMHDYAASDELSPAFMDWLGRIYRRPAIAEAFELGRTPMKERAREMIRRFAGKGEE
jgi:GST-like protein